MLPLLIDSRPEQTRLGGTAIDTATQRGVTFKAAFLALAVAAGCWLSLTFTREPDGLSTLWISSGLVCGILLTSPRWQWPVCLLTALAANMLVRSWHGDPAYSVFGLGSASTLEALVVAAIVARHVNDVTDASHIKLSAWVASLGTIAACAASALLAAALLAYLGAGSFASVFEVWFASHALGMIIFATLTVIARGQGRRVFGQPGRRFELALTVALNATVCLAVFSQSRYPLQFLVYLPLLLAVFRQPFSGIVFGTTVIAIIATAETLAGNGPFQLLRDASPIERTLLLQAFVASTCLISMPVAVVLGERDMLTRRLRKSEMRYRMLADNSRDLIVRIRRDATRVYVSPSVMEILGWSTEEILDPRSQIVHADDVAAMTTALNELFERGGTATISYRARHKDGRYLWIEAHARLVSGMTGAEPEVIYSGRDVTRRLEAERALAANEHRLRSITDSLPAFVAHFDARTRCTFANAYTGKVLGVDPASLIGRSFREVIGEENHAAVEAQVHAVLRGRDAVSESDQEFQGQRYHFQSIYVPDLDSAGTFNGFHVAMFDISRLKHAEHELVRLARNDTLTGLANRRHFSERLRRALTDRRDSSRPIALLYLDIDRFKHINDALGHVVGDYVLREFAHRIRESVRDTDLVARLGGDEFVVLVERVDTPDIPEAIARRIVETMQASIAIRQNRLRVTTSIGVAHCGETTPTEDELMRLADEALYAAKMAGRNTYRMTTLD